MRRGGLTGPPLRKRARGASMLSRCRTTTFASAVTLFIFVSACHPELVPSAYELEVHHSIDSVQLPAQGEAYSVLTLLGNLSLGPAVVVCTTADEETLYATSRVNHVYTIDSAGDEITFRSNDWTTWEPGSERAIATVTGEGRFCPPEGESTLPRPTTTPRSLGLLVQV